MQYIDDYYRAEIERLTTALAATEAELKSALLIAADSARVCEELRAELATLRQLARDLTQNALAYNDYVMYVPSAAFERLRDAVGDAGLSKNRSVSGDGE